MFSSRVPFVIVASVSLGISLCLLVQVIALTNQVNHLTETVGSPSRDYYNGDFSSIPTGKQISVQADGSYAPVVPTLWQLADARYKDSIHLRPLALVPEETLNQMASLDGYEMKILTSDAFWNGVRVNWLNGDEDADGIPNTLDACPDSPAPNDPLPLYMQDNAAIHAWTTAHGDQALYVPDYWRDLHITYEDWGMLDRLPDDPGPSEDERFNLYYGCDEEYDPDHDGIAAYRDHCEESHPTADDPVIDHNVVRGPKSLFPPDQGCTASQVAARAAGSAPP